VRLDIEGVGVGVEVGVVFSKMQIVGKLFDMTILERDCYRNLEHSPSIGGKRKWVIWVRAAITDLANAIRKTRMEFILNAADL
jgi:hypothetical protein